MYFLLAIEPRTLMLTLMEFEISLKINTKNNNKNTTFA